MTARATPDEILEPASGQPGVVPTGQLAALQALAAVTRALAALTPDADDSALVDALGAALIPEFADLCLFHTADSTGQLHLVGVAPPASAASQQLIAVLDEQGALMTVYEPLVDDERPVLILADGAAGAGDDDTSDDDTAEHLALVQAAGLSWELVVPLHAGGMTDALLVIDRTNGQRGSDRSAALQLADVLAALVSGWRSARQQRRSVETLRTQLDEAAFAGRELAHTLNNSLTMPVGVVELLLDRSALSADLQEMVQAASADLAALERHIREFQEQMRGHSSGRMRAGSTLPPP